MKKHTPGPWRAEVWKHYCVVTSLETCGLVSRRVDRKEDAQLIAAAPELLEFLKKCVKGAESNECEPADLLGEAKALIAKVEGK